MTFAWMFLAQQDAAKILLVGTKPDHAYATHMYMFESELLAKCLKQTKGVETAVSLDWPKDPKELDGVRSIVFYSRPAGDIVLSPGVRDAFRGLMSKGAGYVAIHWATESDEKNKSEYLNVLGGWFHRPPCGLKTAKSRLVQLDASHPVCRGWKEYEIRDEFYLDLEFHGKTKPLLKVSADGKEQVVAWAFERPDGGRSFGTTLGHFHDNFAIVDFRRALVNGILWSAKIDVPAAGAPVALGEEGLKLPLPPPPAPKK